MNWFQSKLKTRRSRGAASTDRDLQELRSGGDREEIFRRLHQRYHGGIHAFFARHGFPPEECDDLTQETFLRLCRGIETFRGQSRFETWLYEIASNIRRNEIRGRSAVKRDRPRVSLDTEVSLVGDGAAGLESRRRVPDEDLLAKEQVDLVRRGLEKLPPRMRRCLQLRLDQELKLREIAVLEQVSIDTVKSQLAQARKRLEIDLRRYFERAEGRQAREVTT